LSSFNIKPRVICDQQCKLNVNDAYREDFVMVMLRDNWTGFPPF